MTQEEAKALLEKVDNLTKEVETLKEQLATNSKPDYRELAESIQNWCKDEFEPMIENWVKTEYSDMIQGWINEEYTKHTQEWITETLSPAIEKWVMKEYNENLKGWIANEYSDKVNEWLNTEFVGGIQSWINEEYSAQVEKWMTTEFKQHLMESIEEKINANITESRSSKLANIDDILNILENSEPLKPAYSSKHQDNINENKNDNNDEPLFIREMPAEVAPKWNMASAEVKESIKRRAKLYELTNEDQINRFWNNIVFESIKPATSVYEGLDNIKDDAERQVRIQLRRFRR